MSIGFLFLAGIGDKIVYFDASEKKLILHKCEICEPSEAWVTITRVDTGGVQCNLLQAERA